MLDAAEAALEAVVEARHSGLQQRRLRVGYVLSPKTLRDYDVSLHDLTDIEAHMIKANKGGR